MFNVNDRIVDTGFGKDKLWKGDEGIVVSSKPLRIRWVNAANKSHSMGWTEDYSGNEDRFVLKPKITMVLRATK